MFIILPNSLGGLPELIKRIHIGSVSELLYALDKRIVEVNIPKFKFTSSAKLAKPLNEFGLRQMFQNTASFTGMVEWNSTLLRQLVVSNIIQKSGIEVDEEGSVVFSATEVNIGNKFGEAKDVFNATHPFLFFIEGPNGTVLFIGKVENPLQAKKLPLPTRWSDNQPEKDSDIKPVNSQHVLISPELSVEDIKPQQDNLGHIPDLSPNLDNIPDDASKEEVSDRFSLFDVELLNAFSDSTTNVFISPASIKTTLAMLLEGAAGKTADEISEALRIPDIHHKAVREYLIGLVNNMNQKGDGTFIESHNALFTSDKHPVLEKYRDDVRRFYGAVSKKVDFNNIASAVNIINQWVSNSTHGAIREIASSQTVGANSKLVIANAIYFKGAWKNAFNVNNTVNNCFHTAKGCVTTPMMHISGDFNYNFISNLRAHAVEIPYQGRFSMLILLPSGEANVRTVIRDLPHFRLSEILQKMTSTEIDLELPKFSFEYSADMIEYLKMLKIRDIFESNANLSGIIEKDDVLVNNLVHKTKIEVDEKGTVAAASTSAGIVALMGSFSVIADKPFVFFIYHKDSQNIIFQGILNNPMEQRSGLNVKIYEDPNLLKRKFPRQSNH